MTTTTNMRALGQVPILACLVVMFAILVKVMNKQGRFTKFNVKINVSRGLALYLDKRRDDNPSPITIHTP